jgi:voltage-gated potassium channel
MHDIIFRHERPEERAFDVASIAAILLSVIAVLLDSVPHVSARHGSALRATEWGFTALFTIEYALRVWAARERWAYVRSFYGIVDLLAILPSYVSLLFPAGRFLVVLRILRVMRIFRVLKLAQYVGAASVLGSALRASRHKITVFLLTVLTSVVVVGSLMYLIEGPEAGFTSIPLSIYWAIVTLTTVGYGDIAPQTPLGQLVAAALMILGYGIIAVPTGIVTLELDRAARASASPARCPSCGARGHDADAAYCRRCGARLGAG